MFSFSCLIYHSRVYEFVSWAADDFTRLHHILKSLICVNECSDGALFKSRVISTLKVSVVLCYSSRMLLVVLWSQLHFDAIVISDSVIKLVVYHCVDYTQVPRENLIELIPLFVGCDIRLQCSRKVHFQECTLHHFKVIVEVAADYNRTIRVLCKNISSDLEYSQRSVFTVETITTLQVNIQELNLHWSSGQSSP